MIRWGVDSEDNGFSSLVTTKQFMNNEFTSIQ